MELKAYKLSDKGRALRSLNCTFMELKAMLFACGKRV